MEDFRSKRNIEDGEEVLVLLQGLRTMMSAVENSHGEPLVKRHVESSQMNSIYLHCCRYTVAAK